MCASYALHTNQLQVDQALAKFSLSWTFGSQLRFLPHQYSPVLILNDAKWQLLEMNFSLIPSWSKERKPKFATHNARLDGLSTKPTWKKPLAERHCLVPMSFFIEPIYQGQFAGHMVQFWEKNENLLWAAGLWDEWIDKQSGEVIPSFSIITDDPYPQVEEIGHDRSPLFLNLEKADIWENLKSGKRTGEDWVNILRENKITPEFKVKVDRPLRPGWEKRMG